MRVFSLVFPYFMEFYSEGQANSISEAMEMDGFGLMILKS
jgi:hypothetical protein